MCEKYKVVTLDTGMAVDDHMDMGCSNLKTVFTVSTISLRKTIWAFRRRS